MSIKSKLDAWAKSPEGQKRMQDKIAEYRKSGVTKTAAGSDVMGEKRIRQAASRLIYVMQKTAASYSLPESVMKHFYLLSCSDIITKPDGTLEALITFGGDLHRDSLYTKGYSGVDNIVALLNNGYVNTGGSARNYVYGPWFGHQPTGGALDDARSTDGIAYIHSRKDFGGLHFIQIAIDNFNKTYGSVYNVTAVPGDDYK